MKFLKYILVLASVSLVGHICAQESKLARIPKQLSLEMGYRYLFAQKNLNNSSPHGYGLLIDYAWQLSGFEVNKNKSFISVPMGYTILPAGNAVSKQINMLNYGWTVRHELGHNKNIIPFVGYGLLLNNMRINDTKGSIFGHQTQFDFGINIPTKTKISYFSKIEYSYTSYPQLDEPDRIRLHYFDLRFGIRY